MQVAATRLIALHVNKGKTIAQCLKDRTDYSENAVKTNDGEFISSYMCDPKSCDEEFLLSKREYLHRTLRTQKHDVIAYQIRQSFKPGEVTPEEANKIGYELAMRWTKGEHAFIVATHIDRAHIHNHIIYNSTSLDCTKKYKDFLRSGKALQKVSDIICIEHGLSVITPRPYDEREKSDYRRFRNSEKTAISRNARASQMQLVVDIEKIISANKGPGYERWAKKFNLKQTAKALCFLQEHGIENYEELEKKASDASEKFDTISAEIKSRDARLDEIAILRRHIYNFAKTRDTYEEWKRLGFPETYYEEHHAEIDLYQAAKEAFKPYGFGKLPKVATLNAEFDHIVSEKKEFYSEYREAKKEMQELLIAKQNIEALFDSGRNGKEKLVVNREATSEKSL